MCVESNLSGLYNVRRYMSSLSNYYYYDCIIYVYIRTPTCLVAIILILVVITSDDGYILIYARLPPAPSSLTGPPGKKTDLTIVISNYRRNRFPPQSIDYCLRLMFK